MTYLPDDEGARGLSISPDGQQVVFERVADANDSTSSLWIMKRDGSGLRKLADRGPYRGVVEVLDTPDFHSESSHLPVWAADSRWVYYTAVGGDAVELMRVSLEGKAEQWTPIDTHDVCIDAVLGVELFGRGWEYGNRLSSN